MYPLIGSNSVYVSGKLTIVFVALKKDFENRPFSEYFSHLMPKPAK